MATCDINVGAVVQATVVGNFNGVSDVQNSFQFRYAAGDPLTLGEMGTVLVEIVEDIYTLVKAVCNVLQVWEGITASHLNGNCSTGFLPFDSPIVGALATQPTPPGVAVLYSFPTGFKRVVPRKYFGALDESAISASGNISAGFSTELDALRDHMLGDLTTATTTWHYGYYSPKLSEFVRPIAGKWSTYPAYQTRRKQRSS